MTTTESTTGTTREIAKPFVLSACVSHPAHPDSPGFGLRSPREIDLVELLNYAADLASLNLDYVYEVDIDALEREGLGEGCLYVHDADTREGGCIFGTALLDLGVDPTALTEGMTISSILLGYEAHRSALSRLLSAIQGQQDQGIAWGRLEDVLRAAVVLAGEVRK